MKPHLCLPFLAFLSLCAAQDIPYTVAAQPWLESLGNHRARVTVSGSAPAVQVRIPWRRHDGAPESKTVLVTDSAGRAIGNATAFHVGAEFGDVVFEASSAGRDYFVYYMPLAEAGRTRGGEPKGAYRAPANTADASWLARWRLRPGDIESGGWRKLPRAAVAEFQSRTRFDSFWPMEVVATREEMARLEAEHPEPYLLFAEDSAHAVRMRDALPRRWIESGPRPALEAEVHRGEFFVFQAGIYAQPGIARGAGRFSVAFEELSGAGGVIPASNFECFNTGGVDIRGKEFRKDFTVAPGAVGALWCGVQVPPDAKPGRYAGNLVLGPEGAKEMPLRLTLEVSRTFLRAGGVDQPERLARLRWLNSTAGLEEKITSPYTPLRVSGTSVASLGREVRFGAQGFPESIQAGGRELLAAPVRLRVDAGGAIIPWKGNLTLTSSSPAKAVFESRSEGGAFGLKVAAVTDYDGGMGFDVRLRSERDSEVSDIALEIPLRAEAVPYVLGMGHNGGRRPAAWDWKWTDQPQRWKDQNSNLEYFIWLGGVHAGLFCRLKSPLEDWRNGIAGGASISESGGRVLFRARSGRRGVRAGEELSFSFRLLPTPVKPLEPARFNTRYCHSYRPAEEVRRDGATVVNIHHDTLPNVWINYPFLNLDLLTPYVREAHNAGLKVKIYYTIRELTTRLPELWAFRSLGEEIYSIVGTQAHGAAGLDSWLREHLVTGYTPAWITRTPVGEVDAALRTHRDSRLNNFYLAGLGWLLENVQIDGIYLDEIGYGRDMMQRVRKVLETRPGAMIDLHGNRDWWSCNSPAGYYMEHLPYVDRVWFGEAFDPDSPPDFWLTEMSGIPFGLPGDLLENPNLWRGALFGMTNRLSYSGVSPVGIWKLWSEFGIDRAEMTGWWEPDCPVRTGAGDVLATVYKRSGKSLIAIASWARDTARVRLQVDWKALGLDPARVRLRAPAIAGFQPAAEFAASGEIPVEPKKGWMLVAE